VVHDVPQWLEGVGLWQVPLQLSVVPGQAQALFAHCWPPVQALVQVPQWLLSFVRFTQAPLQLLGVVPLQARSQETPVQIAWPVEVPLVGPGQAAVQEAPHWLAAVGLSQVPLQLRVVAGQLQALFAHCCPPVQALLQLPQWLLSVATLTQVPLQFIWPDEHPAPPPAPPVPLAPPRAPPSPATVPPAPMTVPPAPVIVPPAPPRLPVVIPPVPPAPVPPAPPVGPAPALPPVSPPP
jgi:hypothetical protein